MAFNLQTIIQITVPVLWVLTSRPISWDKGRVFLHSRLQKEKLLRSQQFENVYAYFV